VCDRTIEEVYLQRAWIYRALRRKDPWKKRLEVEKVVEEILNIYIFRPVWIREMPNGPFKINRHYKNMTIKSEMVVVSRRCLGSRAVSWWWWTGGDDVA